MISNADHAANDHSACPQCAHYASEAQQWQLAYLQLESQLVKLQLRIDEVDTMSSLSRHGSMARSRAPTTTSASAVPARPTVQCCDRGVGQGSVCDLVNRNAQTSPVRVGMTPATSDACVSTSAPTAAADDEVVQPDVHSVHLPFGDQEQDNDDVDESPQSSELLTVIPPRTLSPSALKSLSSSTSSSWISTTHSAVLTKDHASQTSCSFLVAHDPFSCINDSLSDTQLPHSQLSSTTRRRKYRHRPTHARSSDAATRPRKVSRRIRGLPKRARQQRPLQVLSGVDSDAELVDYSDLSDNDTSDADVEPSATITSGSDTEASRALSLTPTGRKDLAQGEVSNDVDDLDGGSSSRGEPLEFASDSSMSQPRPPTPPLASKRTRCLQRRQQTEVQVSVLATPPISPSDVDLRHPADPTATSSLHFGGNASSDASTQSIAPSSTNINHVRMRRSASSISISVSDSVHSVSDPPLVAVQGPVPESGSPLGMAAPKHGGVTTDDDEDMDAEMSRDRMPLDSAPTLLSLLDSPAHSFNVLTVSRGGGGEGIDQDSVPATMERIKGPGEQEEQQVPTLSRGTRLDIDLSRLSTITEMSGVSAGSPSAAAIAKPVESSDVPQHHQHRYAQPPLPPMAWPKPPSTTPPPPTVLNPVPPQPVTLATTAIAGAPPPCSAPAAAPRAPLAHVAPPVLAEASPVARSKSKSKSKKRSNASSNKSTSKLGSLMPRRQPTSTSTSSSATVSDLGPNVHASDGSLSPSSATAITSDPYPYLVTNGPDHAGPGKEQKNKGWKAVTSFVTKVKDKVRDKVHHKSHSSKNTAFVAPDTPHPPSSSRRSSLAHLVGLGSHHHHHQGSGGPLSPTSSTTGSIRAVYGPFHSSPSTSTATIVSTAVMSNSESTGAPLSPRNASGGSLPVAGGSSRGTPRPSLPATVGAASGAKMHSHGPVAAAAYGSGGASGAVVGRAPPHSGASVSLSSATGGMVAAAAYASHMHQYQQQKQQHQAMQQGGSASTSNLRPWLGPPPLTKSNSAPGSPHTPMATLAPGGMDGRPAPGTRSMHQSMSVPELYALSHAPTPRHTATASVPIMFPKPVKALGTPKVLLADPLEPSPNMRISMVTLESQPDSTSSRTPSPSLMSLKSDVPLVTPGDAPPVPPLDPSKKDMSLPRSLHLTDVDGGDEEDGLADDGHDQPLQRTHRPSPSTEPAPEVLTLDEVVDQIPVDVRSIASSRISLVLPAPASSTLGNGASNQSVHPAATAAGSA